MAKFISRKPKTKAPSKAVSKANETFSSVEKKLSFLKWIDPFTYVDLFVMPHVKKVTQSGAVEFLVNAFFALIFAFIIYTLLGLAFGTASPLVIVYSASMEPTFFRGDVMALSKVSLNDNFGEEVTINRSIANVAVSSYVIPKYSPSGIESIHFPDANTSVIPNKSGNVIVYNSFPYGLPIIHRAIVLIHANDGDFVLTKGDNQLTNPTYDADCGTIIGNASQKPCITFYAIPVNSIQGKAFFNIPKIGCVKLWLLDDSSSLLTTGKLPKDFSGIC